MHWKEFIHRTVIDYVKDTGHTTFTFADFYDAHRSDIERFSTKNHHPRYKVLEIMQQLRNDGVLEFVDNRGTYTVIRHDG